MEKKKSVSILHEFTDIFNSDFGIKLLLLFFSLWMSAYRYQISFWKQYRSKY